VALVPAVFWLARRWTRSTLAALTVAALALLDRQWLFYAQEARVYALVQLGAVAQFALVAHLLRRPSVRGRVAYVTLAAGLFYLHYTTALLAVASLVAGVAVHGIRRVVGRGDDEADSAGSRLSHPSYTLVQMLCDFSLYLLLTMPAWPHLAAVARRRENWEQFVKQPGVDDLLTVFPLLIYVVVPLLMAAVLAAGHWLLTARRGGAAGIVPPAADNLLVAACWLGVPLAIAWLTSAADLARLFFPRYLIGASAGAMLIAGLCLASRRTLVGRSTLAVALLWLAAWQGGWLWPEVYTEQLHSHTQEQWREAVAALAQHQQHGDPVVLIDAGLIEAPGQLPADDPRVLAYFTFPLRGMYRLPHDTVSLIPFSRHRPRVSAAALQQIGAQQRVSILWRGSAWESDELTLETSSGEQIVLRIQSSRAFGHVRLIEAGVEAP
jgi:mannosyltransferase